MSKPKTAEQAYPPDHPAHPDNAGKPASEPQTPWNSDYEPGHPARGGLGQAVPTEAVTGIPRDGFKHLAGLPGVTLAEAQDIFAGLPEDEKSARLAGKQGAPATADKKE